MPAARDLFDRGREIGASGDVGDHVDHCVAGFLLQHIGKIIRCAGQDVMRVQFCDLSKLYLLITLAVNPDV